MKYGNLTIRKWLLVVFLVLLWAQGAAWAEEAGVPAPSPLSRETDTNRPASSAPITRATDTTGCNPYRANCISSYEPNTVGVTYDRHHEPFLDYKLSLMYPFFHSVDLSFIHRSLVAGSTITFMVVNVRFAQFTQEHSSPVEGMRYNPKLVFRTMLEKTPKEKYLYYWDIAAGHESNGQTVDSRASYDAHLAQVDGKTEFADDAISRGWDYYELKLGRENKPIDRSSMKYTLIGQFKYFLNRGILEKHKEEYQSWENNPAGKPRSEVNGLRLLAKLVAHDTWGFAGIYETGYHKIGRYNSLRGEFTWRVGPFPVMVWAARGYDANDELAAYYRDLTSYGIALNLGSF